MAQIKSQIKRIGTNEKARQRNVAIRSEVKTQVKKLRAAVEAKNLEAAKAELAIAIKDIDKSYAKGATSKNGANRQKSSLAKLVNTLVK
jgi:small subunit ribosomal protein S20